MKSIKNRKLLDASDLDNNNININNNFNIIDNINDKWDQRSDEILINYISKNLFTQRKWKNASLLIGNKTATQCFKRFKIINPKHKKGKWSSEEDALIINLIEIFGKNWSLISNSIKNRSSRQIKVRYENHLSPNLKKSKFNKDEDKLILSLYPKLSNNWSKYMEYLKGRTSKKIKLRYLSIMSKGGKLQNFDQQKKRIFYIFKMKKQNKK